MKKSSNIKCTRRQLRMLTGFLCLPAALVFLVVPALAQTDQILPPIGGEGGGRYVARCPQGWLLTGLELLTGDDVDAIRPLCLAAFGPAEVGQPQITTPRYGGTGGGRVVQVVCPRDAPIVTGMWVRAEGIKTLVVNNIYLWCGLAATTQKEGNIPKTYPAAIFDGPAHPNSNNLGFIIGPARASKNEGLTWCPEGLVAVGINGRSGLWLDSVGLICGPPKLTSKGGPQGGAFGGSQSSPFGKPKTPVKSIGKLEKSLATDGPPMSLCERARDARARNSPAAPDLEAQCRAAGGDPSVKPPPIDVTQHDALAARGEAIANQDPLSIELRSREPDDLTRRGFDIGMAAAEGQIQDGPNKKRMHDSLSPAEQSGFRTALAFSLERNKNAALAAKGAAIADVDPAVAEARIAEGDVFYWLGFDIATAIFGDPALGAQGNTQTGPNSLGIRDGLSAAGQRGFNASVALHLSRNYKP